MGFREFLNENIVYLDGGMGTMLQKSGLPTGELPEKWNISNSDVIKSIHKMYYDAGSNVVSTNTFGANSLKFSDDELENIISSAIKNVRNASKESLGAQTKFVALDIGPTGRLLKPFGDLGFEDAVEIFAKTVKLGAKYGADLVIVETMNDSYETKAALLAVKENCDLPVIVSNAYSEDGKLMTGATPEAMVAMLEGMHADAIGVNCSLGPQALMPVVEKYLEYSSIPVIVKPNAGLPKSVNGETIYDVDAVEFSKVVREMVEKGVRVVGGCCGTTPDYISELCKVTNNCKPCEIQKKHKTIISSYTHAVEFDIDPILIGERINPTGKKRFKEALRENDIDYILKEGLNQQERGVHVLDVNVGLPEIDEPAMLENAVCELQAIIDLPLQIDTSDEIAMERALRRYNGKAMINSVNGKEESMKSVFPLVKKYGGLVVALTLDESGIPETADGRFEIAKRIIKTASEYGISKDDIIFDTLAMTVSADKDAANVTLNALRKIHDELGCHTSLGVSNVSFGLPNRDAVNSTFFALALENGLSAAIMNPYSVDMMKVYYCYRALHGFDANCTDYIDFASTISTVETQTVATVKKDEDDNISPLTHAIIKGLKDKAADITEQLLIDHNPLEIVNDEVIPALDIVGKGFEEKKVYLPQLLMSAEAAKSAFECVKAKVSTNDSANKGKVVIATVKGDIHDIGKNIVKLLLENYGYDVIDLGRDVDEQVVVDEVVRTKAPLLGLSALMTTTVPAMERTIKLVREQAPWCKVAVGGAVLTQEYADSIGADKYSKDAMETVRYAEEIM